MTAPAWLAHPAGAEHAVGPNAHRLHIQPPADAEVALALVAAIVNAIDDDRQPRHRHIQIGEGQAEITDLHVPRHLDVDARLLRVAAAVEYGQAHRVLIVDQHGRDRTCRGHHSKPA